MIGCGLVWYRSRSRYERRTRGATHSFHHVHTYVHGQARGGGQEGLGAAEEEDASGQRAQGEEACHDDVDAGLSLWWWVLGVWLVGRDELEMWGRVCCVCAVQTCSQR